MRDTFVIGDVHGHYHELAMLLAKAAVKPGLHEVVQVGDLAHAGEFSLEADLKCYDIAREYGMVVLWGNHERALVDTNHRFRGAMATPQLWKAIIDQDLKWAYATHDFLITHAGVHPDYMPDGFLSPERVIEIMRERWNNEETKSIYDDISIHRGGWNTSGGILWRDDNREPLFDGVRQVYGHTRSMLTRHKYIDPDNDNRLSWCIDVCDKGDTPNLAGIWLPEQRVVAVGPDASIIEQDARWSG